MLYTSLLVCPSVANAEGSKKIGELKSDGLSISVLSAGSESFAIEISNKGVPVSAPEIFTLENPPRLVIDLPKIEVRGSKKAEIKNGMITGIRLGVHPGKARIVVDLGSATPPTFAVSEGSATKPLAVRVNFSGTAVAADETTAPAEIPDLSDLPKPDPEPVAVAPKKVPVEKAPIEVAKQEPPKAEPIKVETKKEPESKAPIIREPKEPAVKETAKEAVKEPAKNEHHEIEEAALEPAEPELSPDDKEVDRTLKEITGEHGKLKPAPEDLDADFQDIVPEKTLKAPTKEAAKEPIKETTPKGPAVKSETIPDDTEVSDDEALKMLDLANEVAGKNSAPAPKTPEAAKGSKTLADLAAEQSKKQTPPVKGPDAGSIAAGAEKGGAKGAEKSAAAAKAAEPAAEESEEEATPEQLAKLLNESEKTTPEKTIEAGGAAVTGSQAGSAVTPPAGGATVKGIFYRAADDGKTSAVVIEVGNLNNYSLSQKKKNLYELTIDQSGLAGEHVAYPQFPPDTFQGFEAVLAEQQGTAVVVKLYVAEGTKLSPFRVKDQLWVKVLK